MKLKYYLRGLGIGIVVTAIIMTVALGNKQPMTDDEVIARAKQLGMIENSVLTDIAGKDEIKDETKDEAGNKTEDKTENEASKPDENLVDNNDDKQEVEKPADIKKEVVSITVVGGDSSWSVAKRMEEAGLIESARDFDTYLCGQGYDKRISVGTYEIPANATDEEMAKIITKTK